MSKTAYHIRLKGYVGGSDFDRNAVDEILRVNDSKAVNVHIDSLSVNLATGLSFSTAFKHHVEVNVHFVGLNASASNIRYAKRFYLLYKDALSNLQQVVEDLGKTNFQQLAENFESIGIQTNISNTNLPQIVADLENYIFKVPWGHQLVLIDKFSEEPEKAIFYIRVKLL